jgi:hypothetical protein
VRRLPVPQLPVPGYAGDQPVPVPQEDIVTMTAPDLAGAIRRAHAQCGQEVAAAKQEYDEGRRKIAAVRKGRNAAARTQRDAQIADLREQFAREQREEGAP